MRRRSLLTFAVALVLALSAAACGEPDSRYLSRKSDGVFAKVPASWIVFDERESYEAALDVRGGQTQRELQRGPYWVRLLGAHDIDGVGPRELVNSILPYPAGLIEVRPLFPDEAEFVNPAAFRVLLLEGHPQYTAQNFDALRLNRLVTVIEERQVDIHGYRGLELQLSLQIPGAPDEQLGAFTGPNIFIMGKAYFNVETGRLIVLRLTCPVDCADDDFDAMQSVYDSLTLRDPK